MEKAKKALADTKQGVIDKLHDSYTRADDAIRSKIDQIFINPQSTSPKLSFTAGSEIKSTLEINRLKLGIPLTNGKKA